MLLPSYFIVGLRPVKAVATSEGDTDILVYDWQTGGFVRDMSYGMRVTMADHDVDLVDADTFDSEVAKLRAERPRS